MTYLYVIVVLLSYLAQSSVNCIRGSQKSVNSRYNYFDIELLRYSAEDRQGNIMVSPTSVKSTLAMVLEGAKGQTADEIRSALRLSPNENDMREELFSYLSAMQARTPGVVLENSNAVFTSDRLKVKKSYEQMLQNVYFSNIIPLDFHNPESTSEIINNWVNNSTRGLIPAIVEPIHIGPTSSVLITNVLYFKSAWKNSFNPSLTKLSCFYFGGKCKNVPTMELHAELNYAYVENLRSHAVELPYEGGRHSMILLVPQDRDSKLALIRDLPYMSLPQVVDLMEPTDVHLALPRFSVDYSEDLVSVLQQMKINSLFTASANLSGIFEGHLAPQVNNIFHKTRIEVNEVGTIAAAATGVIVVPLIFSSIQLRVDRPFLFFIRDITLGAVLFEGKVEEPESVAQPAAITGNWEDGGFNGVNDIRDIAGDPADRFSNAGPTPDCEQDHPLKGLQPDENNLDSGQWRSKAVNEMITFPHNQISSFKN